MPGFGLGAPPASADPMAVDERRRRGLVEGPRGVEQDARPGECQPGRRRTAALARPSGARSPIFDTVRQSYLAISDKLLGTVEEIEGLDDAARSRLRFATKGFVDAMSPANFVALNPQVMKRTIDTKGENLLAGLKNMLGDIAARAGHATAPKARSSLAATSRSPRAR